MISSIIQITPIKGPGNIYVDTKTNKELSYPTRPGRPLPWTTAMDQVAKSHWDFIQAHPDPIIIDLKGENEVHSTIS